ncbi:MAG: Uma2 family endonuclease [Gemmataceae bacterium]
MNAAATSPKRMTIAEFEAKHMNDRVELVDGFVVPMDSGDDVMTAQLASKTPLLTIAEFEAKHMNDRVELVDGVLVELPMPGFEHGQFCFAIAIIFGGFIRSHRLGECVTNDTFIRVREHPHTVRGADFAFWTEARRPRPTPVGTVEIAPDLVIEVRSPSDRPGAVLRKVVDYLECGVQVVLVVNPATQTLLQYRLEDEVPARFTITDTFTLPDLLPGFALPVAELFPERSSV